MAGDPSCVGSKCDDADGATTGDSGDSSVSGDSGDLCDGREAGEFWCEGDGSVLCVQVGDEVLADVLDCSDGFDGCDPQSALCRCDSEEQALCQEQPDGKAFLHACRLDIGHTQSRQCTQGCATDAWDIAVCAEDL